MRKRMAFSHRIRWRIFLLLAVAFCLAKPPGAQAQPLMNAQTYLERGIESYELGDFDRAVQYLGLAIARGFEKREDWLRAHIYLALSYLAYDKRQEARSVFSKLIEGAPAYQLSPEAFPTKAVELFNEVRKQRVSQLEIRTTPGDVQVWLNGRSVGSTTKRTGRLLLENLLVGKYTLKLTKPFFIPQSVEVEVQPETTNQIEITLQRRRVRLRITVDPEGASVNINGKPLGNAPLTLDFMAGEAFQVECRAPYYVPQRMPVQIGETQVRLGDLAIPIERGQALLPITLERVPPGTLVITSEPPGATVLLDDQLKGQTPLTLESVPAGPHRIALHLETFDSQQRTIEVQSEQTHSLHFLLGHILQIVSYPPGAEVSLNGTLLGQTPLTSEPLPKGRFMLRLTHPAYLPLKREVEITEVGKTMLRFPMLPRTGTLIVRSEPASAEVFLDGQSRGRTPLVIAHLSVGEHRLEIRQEGYRPWRKKVSVRFKEVTWKFASLKPWRPSP